MILNALCWNECVSFCARPRTHSHAQIHTFTNASVLLLAICEMFISWRQFIFSKWDIFVIWQRTTSAAEENLPGIRFSGHKREPDTGFHSSFNEFLGKGWASSYIMRQTVVLVKGLMLRWTKGWITVLHSEAQTQTRTHANISTAAGDCAKTYWFELSQMWPVELHFVLPL